MSEWQPIKTAPKDGTHVLISEKVFMVDVGYSYDGFLCVALCIRGKWRTFPGNSSCDPVYWMPLPEPPK